MILLGLMAAAHPVVPLCLIFLHRLQRWLARQRLVSRRHKPTYTSQGGTMPMFPSA